MPSRRDGRGGGSLPRDVQVSKKLSWLLRHGAEAEGLPLDPGGFANLEAVLTNRKLRGLKITLDEVRAVVADNDKQRFTLRAKVENPAAAAAAADDDGASASASWSSNHPADYLIRANQGHSIKAVDAAGLLRPVTRADNDVPADALVVHGTTRGAWAKIQASGGLKPMGRNHVHFARGLPAGVKSLVEVDVDGGSAKDDAAAATTAATTTAAATTAPPVISGMRTSSTILIFVDLGKALDQGIEFWRSDNDVILSAGNADGLVPLACFKRVEDRTGQAILVEDGVVLAKG